jgi:hypothetical protein
MVSDPDGDSYGPELSGRFDVKPGTISQILDRPLTAGCLERRWERIDEHLGCLQHVRRTRSTDPAHRSRLA